MSGVWYSSIKWLFRAQSIMYLGQWSSMLVFRPLLTDDGSRWGQMRWTTSIHISITNSLSSSLLITSRSCTTHVSRPPTATILAKSNAKVHLFRLLNVSSFSTKKPRSRQMQRDNRSWVMTRKSPEVATRRPWDVQDLEIGADSTALSPTRVCVCLFFWLAVMSTLSVDPRSSGHL